MIFVSLLQLVLFSSSFSLAFGQEYNTFPHLIETMSVRTVSKVRLNIETIMLEVAKVQWHQIQKGFTAASLTRNLVNLDRKEDTPIYL